MAVFIININIKAPIPVEPVTDGDLCRVRDYTSTALDNKAE